MFSFLKTIFSQNPIDVSQKSATNDKKTISFDREFVHVCEGNKSWFGFYSQSSNRRYAVAWVDSTRDDKNYIVIEDGKVIIEGMLERPSDGKIANNGVFILHDQLKCNNLNGIFYAFNSLGELLVKHKVNANLDMFNNKLSNDGKTASFKTCGNKNSDDGNKIFTYDLETKTLIRKNSRRDNK